MKQKLKFVIQDQFFNGITTFLRHEMANFFQTFDFNSYCVRGTHYFTTTNKNSDTTKNNKTGKQFKDFRRTGSKCSRAESPRVSGATTQTGRLYDILEKAAKNVGSGMLKTPEKPWK